MHTAEGHFASKNFTSLKKGIDLETPIIDSLYNILFKEESAEKIIKISQKISLKRCFKLL